MLGFDALFQQIFAGVQGSFVEAIVGIFASLLATLLGGIGIGG